MSEWSWYASQDEENYTIGPCATKEEAIEEAVESEIGYDFDDKTQHKMVFHVVEARKAEGDLAAYFDASRWAEDLECNVLEEEFTDYNDRSPLEGLDTISLESAVRSAIRDWQKQSGFKMKLWRFAECRNGEWIERTFPLKEPTNV